MDKKFATTNSLLELSKKLLKNDKCVKDVIGAKLDEKVEKVVGKGLSTNDLTDELKQDYDMAVENSHTHSNKSVIDEITSDRVSKWDNKAESNDIPTNISELNNDSNYQTKSDVNTTLLPYAKSEDVTKEITNEIARVVADAPESLDTLKKLSDWIADHEDDASAMNSAIQDNKNNIEKKLDKNQLDDTLTKEGYAADAKAVGDALYKKADKENPNFTGTMSMGRWGKEDTENKYAHIVGNGTLETNRSNAHTVDWDGNGWYAGKLTQEGTPTEEKDLATKKYVDDKKLSEFKNDSNYERRKYFNFIEAGVNVEGNPTYDEIKEAILSDVTPVLIHGHYIAHMTSGHWDSEGFEREELPGFTFVTQRSDMNNHWKIKCTEFWCTKQDDGSTLWAVGTHYLDAFIAEYNVTPAEAVIDAYEKGLEIIVKRSEMPDQPAHYARLVRADGYGVTPNLTFTCEENKLSHHYHINGDGWHYWCYNLEDDLNGLNSKISGLQNSVGSIGNILKSVYSFRGGFCNNAGTLHIKNPGIYLIMQGGTGNKQITIKQPRTTALEAKWNGVIVLAYEGGVVTPIGIESSLTIAGAFKTPGTFQGWTPDGSYSTTINYPAKCVVAYLGNSNVDYLA